MSQLLRFDGAAVNDPAIEPWFDGKAPALAAIAREWFDRMRGAGPKVVELLHDGFPVVLVEDAPFAYVDAFRSHVNVGFFRGAELPDPAGLLEGAGKLGRHVKLRPERPAPDGEALSALIHAAYENVREHLQRES